MARTPERTHDSGNRNANTGHGSDAHRLPKEQQGDTQGPGSAQDDPQEKDGSEEDASRARLDRPRTEGDPIR
jgi:hypothetical protein